MTRSSTSFLRLTLLHFILLAFPESQARYDNNYRIKPTRSIILKQGVLEGIVVKKRLDDAFVDVEQYLGIPYAKPPVGDFRFMPPAGALSWNGTKYADKFRSVCPQMLPSLGKMEQGRREHVKRLLQFLNESEDCLYLNIYAPYQDENSSKKYPVMVYIHGESFEWNSGNAYDGSVLAAFGEVIVVTLNFRLGVLGFLKINRTTSNFGLIDQIAALLWIKENIASFGGDPTKITLFGHGTGAACISHLMQSSMNRDANASQNHPAMQKLFQRAILMSGNSLSDWALATNPDHVTKSIAKGVGCDADEDSLISCLRSKNLYALQDAAPPMSPYATRLGPVIDGTVISDSPEKIMNTNVLSMFEMMYGLTDLEGVQLLGTDALAQGLPDREFRAELGAYLGTRCGAAAEAACVRRTLERYGSAGAPPRHPFASEDAAARTRDVLLDALSDARTAAPVVALARMHSARNGSSYFYVFAHRTASRSLNLSDKKSVHGEDLPFVFGVPLDPPPGQIFTKNETRLSKMMMSLWSNFAYTGNPNNHDYMQKYWYWWYKYGIKWPEYDSQEQYLNIDVIPSIKAKYRDDQMRYWNKIFPQVKSGKRDGFTDMFNPTMRSVGGQFITTKRYQTNNIQTPKTEVLKPITPTTANTTNIIIILAVVILLINIAIFTILYYRCVVVKKKNSAPPKASIEEPTEGIENIESVNKTEVNENGCNIIKMIGTKSSKSGDTYEAVKTHKTESSKRKLTRQFSSSTIDAHTKVREWIAQEIVNKYSPKNVRKNRRQISLDSKNSKKKERKSDDFKDVVGSSGLNASNSTLGQSPTRPVTPAEEIKDSPKLATVKKKAEKVSVAIDATPSGRGPSVLRQEPIELTKSLDYSSFDSGDSGREIPLRRSATLDDVWSMKPQETLSKRNSTSINLQLQQPDEDETTVIKIEHHHSKSDPVDTRTTPRKLKTFDPGIVNVTSRDEADYAPPLTPEESLQVIKRRNCPKVLPDLPGLSKNSSHKRRSMPVPSYLFLPIPENSSFSQPSSPHGPKPIPPPPPPRVSTLGRLPQSCPRLAEEPPIPEEPKVACNNLYIGPLIPSRENRKVIMKPADNYTLDNQPIYDNLNPKSYPKTIITADNSPVRKIEPKVIIKPTISRTISDPSKSKGPRVVVHDNLGHFVGKTENVDSEGRATLTRQNSTRSPSPTKENENNVSEKKESSTDSTPSEESDTGTIVKK